MILRSAMLGLLPFAVPLALVGQQPASANFDAANSTYAAERSGERHSSSPVGSQPAATGPRAFGAGVLIGGTTYTDIGHGVVGLRVNGEHRGWGVLGLAELGRGGYDSRLLAAAATRRVVAGNAWSIVILVGGGAYSETGPTHIERSAPGLLYGLEARRRIGPVTLYLLGTDFRGSYEDDHVVDHFAFNVPRIRIGVGF